MANLEHLKVALNGTEAISIWREENPEVQFDLSGANLRRFNFVRANLCNTNLRNSNLEWADCRWADFAGSNLSNTNLSRADFHKADLQNAVLLDAILTNCNLEDANCRGANFQNARFGKTRLLSTDLSVATNLQTTHHEGPSILDPETLIKSGHIPSDFLRGCGLTESTIMSTDTGSRERINESLGVGVEYYSCFLSYSHFEKLFAKKLHDKLQKRGIRCWLDEHQLFPGDDMHDGIDRGIRLWDKVLLCCSEASLTSWWVDKEIDRAIEKEKRLWNERGKKLLALIPLDLDRYLFDGWENSKKDMIITRLAADFKGWETDDEKFKTQFERVVKALRADEGAREKPPISLL